MVFFIIKFLFSLAGFSLPQRPRKRSVSFKIMRHCSLTPFYVRLCRRRPFMHIFQLVQRPEVWVFPPKCLELYCSLDACTWNPSASVVGVFTFISQSRKFMSRRKIGNSKFRLLQYNCYQVLDEAEIQKNSLHIEFFFQVCRKFRLSWLSAFKKCNISKTYISFQNKKKQKNWVLMPFYTFL